MEKQRVLCSETDCIHNIAGFVKSFALLHSNCTMYDYYCKMPDGIVISAKRGCQSKETKKEEK
jgi:hypothetical protein